MKDSSRHIILGTQQFKPTEFASQINLSMDNAWGVVRCIIDLVRDQKDGKYLIVKDPNKPVIRLYDIPDNTFDSEEDSDSEEDGQSNLKKRAFANIFVNFLCFFQTMHWRPPSGLRRGLAQVAIRMKLYSKVR